MSAQTSSLIMLLERVRASMRSFLTSSSARPEVLVEQMIHLSQRLDALEEAQRGDSES